MKGPVIWVLGMVFGILAAPAWAEDAAGADNPLTLDAHPVEWAEAASPKKSKKKRVTQSAPVETVAEVAPRSPVAREKMVHAAARGNPLDPHFSVLFDLVLAFQPGKADFSFLNYHPLLLLEVSPTPDLQFSFEVNPNPRYYELDWNATPWLTLRLGKIWIPFDDLNPHNLFGGFINTSRLRLGTTYFLPDIWADLGLGARFQIADSMNFSLVGDLYVINGFGNLAQTGPLGDPDYPNLSDTGISGTDNNADKAVGMRLGAKFFQKLSLGMSFYTGRWSADASPSARLTMVGLDAQFRLPTTEFKFGVVTMPTSLTNGSKMGRVGQYAEINQKFGSNNEWRALVRLGYVDTDDRFTDANDVLTLGGGIRYRPGVVQFALEHYQDLKNPSSKAGTSLTFLRTIVQL